MKDTWTILNKELAFHGFKLQGAGQCEFHTEDGNTQVADIGYVYNMLQKELAENAKLFSSTWEEVANMLYEYRPDNMATDERSSNLFIFAVKDLIKLLDCFEGTDDSRLYKIIQYALERDINSFNREQIKRIPDYKIALDWLHRLISKIMYVQRLLQFAMQGEKAVSQREVKMAQTAAGISGPWANLDLPVPERVWAWDEEDENFRGEDRNKRKQRRYNKGLANYNNDGRVGEGHYWRELRNEPYAWDNRESDGIYPGRNVLTRH